MQTFGQSNRSNPPRPPAGSPLQPMLLMQSPVVNDRVLAAKDSRVQRLLDTYKNDNARVVDELFLATLSRPPSDAEKQVALAAMDKNRVEGAQDLQWALINQVSFSLTIEVLRMNVENRGGRLSDPARSAEARRAGTAGRIRRCACGRSSSPPPKARLRRCSRAAPRAMCFSTSSPARISHVESFDFKENSGTPKDLDVRKIKDDLSPLAPPVPADRKAHGQVRHPALHAEPRRSAFPRASIISRPAAS